MAAKARVRSVQRTERLAPTGASPRGAGATLGELAPEIAAIIDAVQRATGRDLRGYRPSALSGAVHRRMSQVDLVDATDYAARLRRDAGEAKRLLSELRPRVPRLFRDLTALEGAARQLRDDRRRRGRLEATRAWIPGCGAGEEAYSAAALLLEGGPFADHGGALQVLATDVGPHALDAARAGRYPAEAFTDVPPERLVSLFLPEGEGYRVSKALRAAVTFLEHDVLADPPFTGLDLVICRTLLLYLTPDARRLAISTFHRALRGGGLLLLGAADALDPRELVLFEPVASRWRLFRRRPTAAPARPRALGEGAAAPAGELQLENRELSALAEELELLNEEHAAANEQLTEKLQELQQANDDLANLLGATDVAIVFLDARLSIQRFTPAAAALLRLDAASAGRPYREIAPDVADERLLDDALAVLRGGSIADRLVEARGARCFVRRLAPYRREGGRVDGVVVSYTEVTALKAAEEEQRALEARMLEAQKLESLGALAGGVAHDFNNILLTVMASAATALADVPPGDPLRQSLEDIDTAARRAAELCQQMLAYSGRGRFVMAPLDLSSLVDETLRLVRSSLTRGAQVTLALGEGLPRVHGDAVQLRQVIMNLLLNASEALPGGAGELRVRTGVAPRDRAALAGAALGGDLPAGANVFVEVEDTGAGMEAETRRRIFEPFYSTKRPGRGLGLPAVLGIVRGHRGAIELQTEPGVGTTFRVLLPAYEGAPQRPEAPPPSGPVSVPSGGDLLALVVDDDAGARSAARRVLTRARYRVIDAEDGQAAVARLAATPDVAFVVLDLTMPGMSGDMALRALRRLRPGLPVIVTSGWDETELGDLLDLEPVTTAFLQKPWRPREMLARIDALLRATGVRPAGE